MNAPLSPSDLSQFLRNDFWASQTEKSISMPGFHCCEHSVKFISLQGFGDRKELLTLQGCGSERPCLVFVAQLTLEAVGSCWERLGDSLHRRNVSQGRRRPAKQTLDGRFLPVPEKGVAAPAAKLPGQNL